MAIRHYSVPLMVETMEQLKAVVGMEFSKDALTEATLFTIKNYKKKAKEG